jgi:alpha-1,6-mannosyltransferase
MKMALIRAATVHVRPAACHPHAEVLSLRSRGLTFCDVSTFYCGRGGGVRTYHHAKLDWFSRQTTHRYVLVYPGPRFRVTSPAPAVSLVEVAGPRTGPHRDGYRLLLNYRQVRRVLADLAPDVIEAGDPWVSGPWALAARRSLRLASLVTSFYHTDSLEAYLEPWLLRRTMPVRWRQAISSAATRLFWKLQSAYDHTLVSSRSMERRVRAAGIVRVVRTPFGVEPAFLEGLQRKATAGRPARVLYAGRLQQEKSFDIVLAALPELLAQPGVHVTVAGDGPYAGALRRIESRRLSVAGYVHDRGSLRELYRTHDVLIAPSATETFGLATLEAMATGIVVVGAVTGGVGDLMRQCHSPFTFQVRSAAGLLRAALEAVDADRAEPAKRSRLIAESYGTWGDAIARQTSVYCALVRDRPTAPARPQLLGSAPASRSMIAGDECSHVRT